MALSEAADQRPILDPPPPPPPPAARQPSYLVEAANAGLDRPQALQFDPTRNPRDSQERRDVVLNRMAELGYITTEQAREAKAQDVEDYLDPKVQYNGCTTSFAPYFCDYAIRQVTQLQALGATREEREAAWHAGGYKVYTTLDMKAQKAAEEGRDGRDPAEGPQQEGHCDRHDHPGLRGHQGHGPEPRVGHGRSTRSSGGRPRTTTRSTRPTVVPRGCRRDPRSSCSRSWPPWRRGSARSR